MTGVTLPHRGTEVTRWRPSRHDSTATATPRTGARVHVQKFGTFLSNMIMPNIAAFIAWGLITAFFIEVGWIAQREDRHDGRPGDQLRCSPILIAYTGGKHRVRRSAAGVVGGFAGDRASSWHTSEPRSSHRDDGRSPALVPMFLGAMIMGPLGGLRDEAARRLWDGKIKPGFEMLVNIFSAGILGGVMAIVGFMFLLARSCDAVIDRLGNGVDFLVDNNLLPLTSIFIEPAKVLFLNNAINHGVLTPLGIQEAAENGKSVLFLLEANPGPGLGLLLAYIVLRQGHRQGDRPRRGDHPVLRRHPRGLLPLRADEAAS